MNKDKFIKIRNIVIAFVLVLFLTNKLVLYFQTINIEDEIQFYDPITKTDELENTNKLVNINTATLEELQTISGIGPTIAQRIIDYRTLYGNFVSIEEITMVKGIGEATFNKIKDFITIENKN